MQSEEIKNVLYFCKKKIIGGLMPDGMSLFFFRRRLYICSTSKNTFFKDDAALKKKMAKVHGIWRKCRR